MLACNGGKREQCYYRNNSGKKEKLYDRNNSGKMELC